MATPVPKSITLRELSSELNRVLTDHPEFADAALRVLDEDDREHQLVDVAAMTGRAWLILAYI